MNCLTNISIYNARIGDIRKTRLPKGGINQHNIIG